METANNYTGVGGDLDSAYSLPATDDTLVTKSSPQTNVTTCPADQPSCTDVPPNSTPVDIVYKPGYQLLKQALDLPGWFVNPAPFTSKKHFKLM